MKTVLAHTGFTRTLIWLLAGLTLVLGWCPPPGWAMLAPAVAGEADAGRMADLQIVQRALEFKVVQQRLLDLGLTPDEVQARLARLPNEDLHQMATDIDALMPGGDAGVGIIIAVLVIVILVVILVYLLNHKISIEKA